MEFLKCYKLIDIYYFIIEIKIIINISFQFSFFFLISEVFLATFKLLYLLLFIKGFDYSKSLLFYTLGLVKFFKIPKDLINANILSHIFPVSVIYFFSLLYFFLSFGICKY